MTDPKDWKWKNSTEKKLYTRINKLNPLINDIVNENISLSEIIDKISEISQAKWWKDWSHLSAFEMVKSLVIQNAATWRDAARNSQNSGFIYQVLRSEFSHNVGFQTIVANNAFYISTVPNDIAKHLTEHIATEAIRGTRAESLLHAVRSFAPHLTKTRAALIARTETAKSQAAIVETRATQIGINWYQWDTVHDQRVRSSHAHMQGVYCQFNSPPSPEALAGETSVGYYNPGGIWNCRCTAYPVVDVDLVSFPIRIVRNGRIVRITKQEFLALQ